MDNLALWTKVEKTDPKHTKPITGKSYQGTSPKPYHLIHKATEVFGPCGIGWGFTIVDERVEDAGAERVSIARVRVWYKWNGKRGEVEHVGGTPFSGVRSSGKPYSDEDAPKKSVTDALVKALSLIGFAGDIFIGRYDDSKYVNNLRDELEEEARSAAKKGAAAPPPEDPFTDPPPNLAALLHAVGLHETYEDLNAWGIENKTAIGRLPKADADKVRAAFATKQRTLKEAKERAAA